MFSSKLYDGVWRAVSTREGCQEQGREGGGGRGGGRDRTKELSQDVVGSSPFCLLVAPLCSFLKGRTTSQKKYNSVKAIICRREWYLFSVYLKLIGSFLNF